MPSPLLQVGEDLLFSDISVGRADDENSDSSNDELPPEEDAADVQKVLTAVEVHKALCMFGLRVYRYV